MLELQGILVGEGNMIKEDQKTVFLQSGDQNVGPGLAVDQQWEHEQVIFLNFLISPRNNTCPSHLKDSFETQKWSYT